MKNVCVIGAGVIGLSTAVNVLEQISDVDVTIIAEKLTPDTTSDAAAGYWLPPNEHISTEQGRDIKSLTRWFYITREHIKNLMTSMDGIKAGAGIISGWHLFNDFDNSQEDSYDTKLFLNYQLHRDGGLFNYRHASFLTTYFLEGKKYLKYLTERFQKRGGKIIQGRVNSMEELVGKYDVVVTCVGLGAKTLLGDDSMVPIRGQVAKIHAPWMKHFLRTFTSKKQELDTYIYPGQEYVTIGGTRQEGDYNLASDDEDEKRIWTNACKLIPALKDCKPDFSLVGLRPCRKKGVRLETETMKLKNGTLKVVHNYGHSSAGIAPHWGCAQDATQLVKTCLQDTQLKSQL